MSDQDQEKDQWSVLVEEISADTYNFVCDENDKVSAEYTKTKERWKALGVRHKLALEYTSPIRAAQLNMEEMQQELIMTLLETEEPLEADGVERWAGGFRKAQALYDALQKPVMYWRRHFLVSRSAIYSDGEGNTYQGLVNSTSRPGIGECFAAVLNPQSFNRAVPRYEAPNLFLSQEDGMVWCENMFVQISPAVRMGEVEGLHGRQNGRVVLP